MKELRVMSFDNGWQVGLGLIVDGKCVKTWRVKLDRKVQFEITDIEVKEET